MPVAIFILVALVIILPIFLRQVNQYERGVKFTFGRYTKTLHPGWRVVVPIFQSMKKIDMRIKAVDVPDQDTITKDNIPIKISAVVYYRVKDAAKAFIEVENFFYAISQFAQTSIRSAAGEYTLDELLTKRKQISEKLHEEIDMETDNWGIDVSAVEIKDILLPEALKRTIAKAAEAEREAQAVIIKADGDKKAAENLAKAAITLGQSPGAMHLRTLQAINDLSSDQSNTTIWMVPVEIMNSLREFSEIAAKGKK